MLNPKTMGWTLLLISFLFFLYGCLAQLDGDKHRSDLLFSNSLLLLAIGSSLLASVDKPKQP